jgi:2,3-bisphosphoglycerate-independent phosphoglycerate mutase
MPVIFIFVDGIGVGRRSAENPLSNNGWNFFPEFTRTDGLDDTCLPLTDNRILYKPIDACLGVEGLPQSGTGQTTLFSGVNAAKIAGKHFGPFPYSTTRYLLERESLFHKVTGLDKKPVFMNAYPEIFFQKARKKNRWTATTLMAKSAGVSLNTVQDVLEGKAITAEITQTIWREHLGLDVPEISVEEAGQRILNAAKNYNLVMYEFYLTDKAGHSMDREFADRIRDLLNPFLKYISGNLDKKDTLVISSDHGNLEDLSIKTHTRNPVPLLVKGEIDFFKNAESIADVTPAILNLLKREK